MSRVPLLFALALLLGATSACSTPIANRDPVGETFPRVTGNALSGESVVLPDAFAGEPVVLLVGYVQEAQFDLDRWLLGLQQLGATVARVEVPTIDGLLPGMAAGFIDEGMRGGIPREDWASVVTVYDEAGAIVRFTGEERPRNGRILLLDGDGLVRWFHDRGYSATKVAELDAFARELAAPASTDDARG
ncbi:MAG: hypothetical protein H6825_00405 [Planctomycetes bacterium]|nr:hypothetical protein [Planctomycetota bacterium]